MDPRRGGGGADLEALRGKAAAPALLRSQIIERPDVDRSAELGVALSEQRGGGGLGGSGDLDDADEDDEDGGGGGRGVVQHGGGGLKGRKGMSVLPHGSQSRHMQLPLPPRRDIADAQYAAALSGSGAAPRSSGAGGGRAGGGGGIGWD